MTVDDIADSVVMLLMSEAGFWRVVMMVVVVVDELRTAAEHEQDGHQMPYSM